MASTCESLRILVVEDDETDALLIRRALRRAVPQAEVRRAVCVETALRALTQAEMDVALVDWRLPDGLATEVAHGCRVLGRRTPMVFMTRGDHRDPSEAADAHDHVFLSKHDMSPARLRATLDGVVGPGPAGDAEPPSSGLPAMEAGQSTRPMG